MDDQPPTVDVVGWPRHSPGQVAEQATHRRSSFVFDDRHVEAVCINTWQLCWRDVRVLVDHGSEAGQQTCLHARSTGRSEVAPVICSVRGHSPIGYADAN